jgi:hypothetical protein
MSKESNSYINNIIGIKRPLKLIPLSNNNINNIIEREKENILMNKENNKQELFQHNKNKSNILNIKNKLSNGSAGNLNINLSVNKNNNPNNNKIMLKKEELFYIDLISKQKNDLRKLMLKNNNLNRRLNYLNNNSQINVSPIKDLNKIFMPNVNNKSAPKKINNNYKIIKNKYYIHSPSYIKGYEKYQKNINKLNYDYGRNNYNVNNLGINNILPHREILPKVPRKLSPIKKII